MAFEHKGQVHIRPPNTKHRVKYWVDEETTTVVYCWHSAMSNESRIVEWDYSDRLDDADGIINELRDVLGVKKKISSWASLGVGRTIEKYDSIDISNKFDHAVEQAHEKYDLPK